MADHAILSASGSHRWLNCPPSARMEEGFPDRAGASAQEGTYAHAYAELQLRSFYGMEIPQSLVDEIQIGREDFDSEELHDYVEEYTSEVISRFKAEKKKDVTASLLLEQRLGFGKWVAYGFGRGDAVILGGNKITIVDLKYGKNVAVSALENPQLRLYALGALDTFGCLYDIKKVTTVIVQPRNGGISEETLTKAKLLKWGESIKPIAAEAYAGEGTPKVGEWCQFCKAKPRCRAMAEHQLELAKEDFKPLKLLTDAEVADILKRVDELKTYCSSVAEYALEEALKGRRWPGFKLVEGRSVRQYTDPAAVAEHLLKQDGIDADAIYKPKELKGITDMTKTLGRKRFAECLEGFIVKPPGKPKLAPEEDPRPELNDAKNDFEDLVKEI